MLFVVKSLWDIDVEKWNMEPWLPRMVVRTNMGRSKSPVLHLDAADELLIFSILATLGTAVESGRQGVRFGVIIVLLFLDLVIGVREIIHRDISVASSENVVQSLALPASTQSLSMRAELVVVDGAGHSMLGAADLETLADVGSELGTVDGRIASQALDDVVESVGTPLLASGTRGDMKLALAELGAPAVESRDLSAVVPVGRWSVDVHAAADGAIILRLLLDQAEHAGLILGAGNHALSVGDAMGDATLCKWNVVVTHASDGEVSAHRDRTLNRKPGSTSTSKVVLFGDVDGLENIPVSDLEVVEWSVQGGHLGRHVQAFHQSVSESYMQLEAGESYHPSQ